MLILQTTYQIKNEGSDRIRWMIRPEGKGRLASQSHEGEESWFNTGTNRKALYCAVIRDKFGSRLGKCFVLREDLLWLLRGVNKRLL